MSKQPILDPRAFRHIRVPMSDRRFTCLVIALWAIALPPCIVLGLIVLNPLASAVL
jgi:hypothetical protein